MASNVPELLQAMARMEGFYLEGTLAQRNCNPGNIRWGSFAEDHGAIRVGEWAKFKDDASGFQAMEDLLLMPEYKRGQMTVEQALYRWLGAEWPDTENDDDNDVETYVTNVCKWANCKPTDIAAQVLGVSGGNEPVTA